MPTLTLNHAQLQLLKSLYTDAALRLDDSDDHEHIRALKLLPKIRQMTPDHPVEFNHSEFESIAMVADVTLGWHLAGTPTALSPEEVALGQEIQAKLLQANRT
ncbi:hypothetical protein [Phyllobacterium sp. K27]